MIDIRELRKTTKWSKIIKSAGMSAQLRNEAAWKVFDETRNLWSLLRKFRLDENSSVASSLVNIRNFWKLFINNSRACVMNMLMVFYPSWTFCVPEKFSLINSPLRQFFPPRHRKLWQSQYKARFSCIRQSHKAFLLWKTFINILSYFMFRVSAEFPFLKNPINPHSYPKLDALIWPIWINSSYAIAN